MPSSKSSSKHHKIVIADGSSDESDVELQSLTRPPIYDESSSSSRNSKHKHKKDKKIKQKMIVDINMDKKKGLCRRICPWLCLSFFFFMVAGSIAGYAMNFKPSTLTLWPWASDLINSTKGNITNSVLPIVSNNLYSLSLSSTGGNGGNTNAIASKSSSMSNSGQASNAMKSSTAAYTSTGSSLSPAEQQKQANAQVQDPYCALAAVNIDQVLCNGSVPSQLNTDTHFNGNQSFDLGLCYVRYATINQTHDVSVRSTDSSQFYYRIQSGNNYNAAQNPSDDVGNYMPDQMIDHSFLPALTPEGQYIVQAYRYHLDDQYDINNEIRSCQAQFTFALVNEYCQCNDTNFGFTYPFGDACDCATNQTIQSSSTAGFNNQFANTMTLTASFASSSTSQVSSLSSSTMLLSSSSEISSSTGTDQSSVTGTEQNATAPAATSSSTAAAASSSAAMMSSSTAAASSSAAMMSSSTAAFSSAAMMTSSLSTTMISSSTAAATSSSSASQRSSSSTTTTMSSTSNPITSSSHNQISSSAQTSTGMTQSDGPSLITTATGN